MEVLFFIFGKDKSNYKPSRDVKSIVETFCRRLPIQDYFNVTWSKNDPEMFYYEKIEPEDFTQKENEDKKAEAWKTVPGKFDSEDNQSPTKSIKPLPETTHTFQPLLVKGQDDDEENANVRNWDSPSPTSSNMLSYSNLESLEQRNIITNQIYKNSLPSVG